MIKKTVFLIMLFFITTASFTQTLKDTLLASQYYKKADSLLQDRKTDSSIVYLKKALSIYKQKKVWKKSSKLL